MPVTTTSTLKPATKPATKRRNHISKSSSFVSRNQSSLQRRILTPQLSKILLLILSLLSFTVLLHRPSLKTSTLASQIIQARIIPPQTNKPLIIVTAVNYAFRDYAVNLRCSLLRIGIKTPPLIFALDTQTHAWAKSQDWPVLLVDGTEHSAATQENGETEAVFGSKSFNLLSKRKLRAVLQVLRTNSDVLFVDADIVWCSDAANAVSQLVYASNLPTSPTTSIWQRQPPHLLFQTAWPRSLLNSGFYYARSHPDTISAFEAFLSHDTDAENDQVIVNRVLCRQRFGGEELFDNVTSAHFHSATMGRKRMPAACRWNGKVVAKVLDPAMFPTGGELLDGQKLFHYPRRRIIQLCSEQKVTILHNNCILSSKKKSRFIVKGIWYVDDHQQHMTCRDDPAPATLETRKRCGAVKCGHEGDLTHFANLEV